jgi:hypothetical protein
LISGLAVADLAVAGSNQALARSKQIVTGCVKFAAACAFSDAINLSLAD